MPGKLQDMGSDLSTMNQALQLPSPATILVVGGGPAGSFFAIEVLRKARQSGRQIELLVIEQKRQPLFYQSSCPSAYREGCNYCAGGISPRMADILTNAGIEVPSETVTGVVETVIVQGDWKNIEIQVPLGRRMFSVHRGSRPTGRTNRYDNFDSFLLECAVAEGARILTGEVKSVTYSPARRPIVEWTPLIRPIRLPPASRLILWFSPGESTPGWEVM